MRRIPTAALFRLTFAALLAGSGLLLAPVPSLAQQAFPYGAELRLEARPLPGSKRLPWLQFSENGRVDIDLWCVTGSGQAVIVANTITILPTAMQENQCPLDRLQLDKEFLDQLTGATGWRWEGVLLVLDGPQPTRWRPSTN
jgi:heat shock protein HslJ